MDLDKIKVGMLIRTNAGLGGTSGMFVKTKHLRARCPNSEGVVLRHIPGHGGDCWWIKHKDTPDGSGIGAYCFNEFAAVRLGKVRVLFRKLRRLYQTNIGRIFNKLSHLGGRDDR